MKNPAFDLGEELKLREVSYKLHPDLWENFDSNGLDFKFSNWKTIKYLNSTGSDFNNEINQLPNNKGGIYLFWVKCFAIEGITEFPVYIGRAKLTDRQNIRKRCKEYFNKFARNDERPKITRMFKYWSKELYLSYYIINGNDIIDTVEAAFIKSLLLPFNDIIPDIDISQGVKAF